MLHLHLSAIVLPAALAQNQDDHLRLNHGVYFDNRPIYLFAAEERVGARLDGEKPRSSSTELKPTAVPTAECKPTGAPTMVPTTELKPTAVPTVEAKKPTAVPTTQEL